MGVSEAAATTAEYIRTAALCGRPATERFDGTAFDDYVFKFSKAARAYMRATP
jgi:hypothetical protein